MEPKILDDLHLAGAMYRDATTVQRHVPATNGWAGCWARDPKEARCRSGAVQGKKLTKEMSGLDSIRAYRESHQS